MPVFRGFRPSSSMTRGPALSESADSRGEPGTNLASCRFMGVLLRYRPLRTACSSISNPASVTAVPRIVR
jgi:hypothetical protein